MSIEIGYDFTEKKVISNLETKTSFGNNDEYDILNKIINKLNLDKNDFIIISNTSDYLTLQYKNFDIVRVKYTDRTKWLSILILGDNKNNNLNNPIFDLQKNKSQLHWKSKLENKDVDIYIQILLDSIKHLKFEQ